MTVRYIIDEIASQIGCLENERGFVNSTGYSQVTNKGEEINRYYGEYAALVSLYEELTDSTWITKPQNYNLHN